MARRSYTEPSIPEQTVGPEPGVFHQATAPGTPEDLPSVVCAVPGV